MLHTNCSQALQDYKTWKVQQKHNCIVATTKEELHQALQAKREEYRIYLENHCKQKSSILHEGLSHIPTTTDICKKSAQDSHIALQKLSIGFTPTMGALHAGHKSLMEANVAQNHIAVASIFVNPTQFAPTEDLAKYPRTFEKDRALCEEIGIDIIFAPTPEVMYMESDEITLEPPKKMSYILEGYYRPTHFRGVLQVVLKLFHLISPSRAYFGKKDAQQLLIIQKMVQHLCMPIEIIGMPIVRDFDNLALSSRNIYLTKEERQKALALPKALQHIESLIAQNERDTAFLKQEAHKILQDIEIDYLDFYTHNLNLATKAQSCILLAAIRIGNIRLLDNLWIE